MAMVPAPENWMKGIAARTAIVMHVHTGVCRLGDTFDSGLENGSWLSRDMPKQSRIVEAMIDRQQTKMAAVTTSRETVAKAGEKLASMICAGPQASLIAACMLGIGISVPKQDPPPVI